MRIRAQFIFTMLVFGVILAAISASALLTNAEIERASSQEKVAASIARAASELSYLSNDYVIYRESQQLSRWQSRFASFTADIARLQPSTTEEQAIIRNIQANARYLREVFDSIVTAVTSGGSGAPDLLTVQVSWSRMAVQSQGLVADAARLTDLLSSEVDASQRANSIVTIVLIAMFAVYFGVNYLLVGRRTLRSIATLRAGTKVIGSGNLDFKLNERQNDEIGDLSRAFNRMTTNLKTVTASKTELEREITKRQKATETLARQVAIVHGIDSIFRACLTCKTEGELGMSCLNVAQELTGSQIGFIAELGADGLLHDTAMSETGCQQCAVYDSTGQHRPPGNFLIRGLYR
ncbi:MAG: HAMP domain-containing protein, partial [Chloroflexi bacterium]|nr:HAMP domain-containing protein [Chloroflexota bacterium]